MNNRSVYIHVPFCRRKCNYCDFYSAPSDPGAVSSYAKALCNQIRKSEGEGETVHTLYIGGGTPSLLSEQDFASLCQALRETFDLSSLAEFTVECNPESVCPSLAEVWMKNGVDRISMGVQTFSDRHLSRLGRLHTADRAQEAYRELRSVGFKNISLDLMTALPEQSLSECRFDLEQMLSLSPEHISVYLLKIEPESAFGITGVSEADEEFQRESYLLADHLLTVGGYEHYEISNFARPGYRAKHNGVYWAGGEYLAFGPGASGYYRSLRYHIPADTRKYCENNGILPPVADEIVDPEEARKEAVFLGLRLSDGIDRSIIPPEKQSFLEMLRDRGLARLTENRFSLTAEGFLLSDYVIRELLPER